MDKAIADKLIAFQNCFVEHPDVKTLLDDFDELRCARQYQNSAQLMLLLGEEGVGKKAVIEHYQNKYNPPNNIDPETQPIFIAEISYENDEQSICLKLIKDLSVFGHKKQSKLNNKDVDKKNELFKLLKRASVELIVIRNFHLMLHNHTPKQRQIVLDVLCSISLEAKLPIVLVGMPYLVQLKNEPQWLSKLILIRELEYFDFSTDENIKYFRNYLKGLAKFMPFTEQPKLALKRTAAALFSASRGENRLLKQLLLKALRISLIQGETFNIENLSRAFDELNIKAKTSIDNPFEKELQDIFIPKLIQKSQYNPNALSSSGMLIARKFSGSDKRISLVKNDHM